MCRLASWLHGLMKPPTGAAVVETMPVKAGLYHVHVLYACGVIRCVYPSSMSVTRAQRVWPGRLSVELKGAA